MLRLQVDKLDRRIQKYDGKDQQGAYAAKSSPDELGASQVEGGQWHSEGIYALKQGAFQPVLRCQPFIITPILLLLAHQ